MEVKRSKSVYEEKGKEDIFRIIAHMFFSIVTFLNCGVHPSSSFTMYQRAMLLID